MEQMDDNKRKEEDKRRVRAILERWGECDSLMRWQYDIMSDAKARRESMYLIYKSPELDGMPRARTAGKPVESAVVRMEECDALFEDTIRLCTECIMELQQFKNVVDDAVGTLPRQEREIITRRYRDGVSMITAATMVGVSERTGYDREASALERLSGILRVEKIPAGFREKN